MKNLWIVVGLVGGCIGEDVAEIEQDVTVTYDVCSGGRCTTCWNDAADKNRETCEQPVDFSAHRNLARTNVVFQHSATRVIALWSLQAGWRTLAPTYVTGDALAVADLDGDGKHELPIAVGRVVESPRDPASGQATGKRAHGPIRIRAYYDQTLDVDGDGAGDLVWADDVGEAEIGFVKRDQTVIVDPTKALGAGWKLLGGGDVDGNKSGELIWRKGSDVRIRAVSLGTVVSERRETVNAAWAYVGTADLDRDLRADILWRDSSGLILWPSGDPRRAIRQTLDPKRRIETLQDLDGDGVADILGRDDTTKASNVYVLRGTVWTYSNGGVTHEDTWNTQT